jgi:hypothetical protein
VISPPLPLRSPEGTFINTITVSREFKGGRRSVTRFLAPVAVDGSVTGSIGVEFSVAVGGTSLDLSVAPFINIEATATASVGIGMASVGITGALTLLDERFQISTGASLNVLSDGFSSGVAEIVLIARLTVSNEITGAQGTLSFVPRPLEAVPLGDRVVRLHTFATGFADDVSGIDQVTAIDMTPLGDGRQLVLKLGGLVRLIQADGTVAPGVYLDVNDPMPPVFRLEELGPVSIAALPGFSELGEPRFRQVLHPHPEQAGNGHGRFRAGYPGGSPPGCGDGIYRQRATERDADQLCRHEAGSPAGGSAFAVPHGYGPGLRQRKLSLHCQRRWRV